MMRLGLLPHRAAQFTAHLAHRLGAAGPVPDTIAPLLTDPTAGDNATLPDCVPVAIANSARAWALKHGFDLLMPLQALLDLYGATCPCAATASAIAATNGLVMLDAMERISQSGFQGAGQLGVQIFTISGDTSALRDSVFVRGAALVGVDLFPADVTDPLDWSAPPSGDSVGGHALAVVGYDPAGWTVATWGRLVRCSGAWLASRLREAYGPQWLLSVAPGT